ncbi:MAG: hypothetical protein RR585_15745 [Coprobacillus sp.]
MNRQEITISIMNLYNYEWTYFNIKTKEDLKDSIKDFLKVNGDHDFEIQLIDSDYVGLNDNNLEKFLNLQEEFEEVDSQEILYLIKALGVDEAAQTLKEELFYIIVHEDNKIEAFREYITEYNMLDIPDHLESYIDWESVLIDYECGGTTVKRVDTGIYLIK